VISQTIKNRIIQENFARMKYLSLVLMGFAIFVLFIDFAPFKVWDEKYIQIYRILDIILTVISVSLIYLLWFKKTENLKYKDLIIKLSFLIVFIWSALITGLELTSLGFSTLTLIMLIGVFFIYIDFKNSMINILCSLITLSSTAYFSNHLDNTFLPIFFVIFPIAITSVFISSFHYSSKATELANNDKLNELNNELTSIKNHLEEEALKRTEELSIAKGNAEENARLKTTFLTNMSHEIRTPMNSILGFAKLLENDNLPDSEHREYISYIINSGERMLNIINDIIDISKIEAGIININYSKTNINNQLDIIHSFFKKEANIKGINLSIKTTLFDNQAIINTDSDKIFTILSNLIKNAIKYTDSGTIELGYYLRTKYAKISDAFSVLYELEYFVKDTGIGITKEKQEIIFDRFVQSDFENQGNPEGTGLGLSISKAYVEMLGGRIWVESEENEGSIFFFTIPYDVVDLSVLGNSENEQNDKSDLPYNKNKLNILIAEDDIPSAKLLSITVKSVAKKIFNAPTGIETIEICLNNPDIDLILMDIQMQKMNGYEATRKIREFNKKVIIIAQSAFAVSGDKEKALAAGCNDYMTKPINRKVFNNLLNKYFPQN
jgi:signal transduction histidine kinase